MVTASDSGGMVMMNRVRQPPAADFLGFVLETKTEEGVEDVSGQHIVEMEGWCRVVLVVEKGGSGHDSLRFLLLF